MGATDKETSTGSLADKIDYEELCAGLPLSEEEKKYVKDSCRRRISDQNNGQLVGLKNLGTIPAILGQILLSFIQNIQKFFGGSDAQPFSVATLTDGLSSAASAAINSGKQYNFNKILTDVYEDLRRKGIESADIITGVSRGPNYARDNRLERQLQALSNVPLNTSSTLNAPAPENTQLANADVNIGNGLQATRLDSSRAQGLS